MLNTSKLVVLVVRAERGIGREEAMAKEA